MTNQGACAFFPLKAVILAGNDGVRAHLRALLHSFAMTRIDDATEPGQALHLLYENRPDFLICDLQDATRDGVALIRSIRLTEDSPNPYIPIVATVGRIDRASVTALRDAGVTEILAHPVGSHQLFLKIAEIIERPRPYVRSASYFGPDRRRRRDGDYQGPMRRQADLRQTG